MRIYLDLEAGPPPMTNAEKHALLVGKNLPKEPAQPTLKRIARNISREETIRAHAAANQADYEQACADYDGLRTQWLADCEEAAEQAWRNLAKNPDLAVINTIGWAYEGDVYQHSGPDSGVLLVEFALKLPDYAHSIEWVTANGNHYDLPLLHRSVCRLLHAAMTDANWGKSAPATAKVLRKLRDAIPWTLSRGGSSRSIDVMGRGMPRRGRSFGAICEAYLGEGKQGSEDPVGDWLDPSRRGLLLERNRRDVELLMMLDEVTS